MLTLHYHGRILLGIPAIHNRAVFAEIVNQCCADEALRPDAVAVELDPAAVEASAGWLTELGVISGRELPCMLGLTRRNKRIHPQFKEAALRLQERTGRQLHELPPDVLHRELGYAAVSLLCLSPTDSIIEAIRSALELKVPLYGIDMDDPSNLGERGSIAVRDPVAARDDFRTYVNLHGRLTEDIRDQHTDVRRETVMAARLKTLLLRHNKVLFTCGLAHWDNICRLLADENLQPALDVPQHGTVIYKRVLVHPHKAVQHMDIFPGITTAYEALRQPATINTGSREPVNFQEQFRSCLESACARYLGHPGQERDTCHSPQSFHGFGRFSGYLANLCLLSQRMTPDLSNALTAARSMMPGDFVAALADSLMAFNWVSPASFPDLSVICPDTDHNRKDGYESTRAVMNIPALNPTGDRSEYDRTTPFYVDRLHGSDGQETTKLPWQWQDEPFVTSPDNKGYEFNYVWPPCEYLFYASIYEAINVADARFSERRIEPFEGALHDGIDLKASLRSAITGENRLFVKRTLKRAIRPASGEPVAQTYTGNLELQPTVFIFSRETETNNAFWEYLKPGDQELYKDLTSSGKRMFDRDVPTRHDVFIESLHYSESQSIPDHMRPWVRGLRLLHGSLRFGNPCVNFFQSASWLEKGRFKASPLLPGSGSIGEIASMYRERHHIDVDPNDWGNALIFFAIPYTTVTRRVVVVAHRDFRISRDVHQEARRRRVELVVLPLSYFPPGRISEIRMQYSVKAGQGGKEYPPELEWVFGHNQYTYLNLLPIEVRRQTRPRY